MFNFFAEIKKELKLPQSEETYQCVFIGGKILYVEGHKGLVTLSEQLIMFKTKNKIISVSGEKLKLKILSKTTLSVMGEIEHIEINWEN